MAAKNKFIVVDQENTLSWSLRAGSEEGFETFAAAEKRAKLLADSEPGWTIRIYSLVATARAPVGAPEVILDK